MLQNYESLWTLHYEISCILHLEETTFSNEPANSWMWMIRSRFSSEGLASVWKMEEGELRWDKHGRRQDTERAEDTLFSVGCRLTHVCPVSLNEWKSSLFSASCRPGGGPQQLSAARVYENISFCWTEVLLPRGSMSSGVYPQCFVNTWQDKVIVCVSFKTEFSLVGAFHLCPWINVLSSGQTLWGSEDFAYQLLFRNINS